MIELNHISVAFGEKQVLRDLSLRFDAGCCALVGPSGCGKTTLLRVIAGLQQPDAGTVSRDPSKTLSFCFQEDRLLPWYTVQKNITLALPPAVQRDKTESGRIARMWLERVGLAGEANAYPAELSGGMKRRASLARALAMDADVLLMDEPFRALDEAAHAKMLALVRRCAQGKLLILVTHDPADAQGMQTISLG